MPYGLIERDMRYILDSLESIQAIEAAILFGSRAKGTYKVGSDVDLAICGKAVTQDLLLKLADRLNEEQPLPYFFDIVHYETISTSELKAHIDRVGIPIFARNSDIHTELEN
jgi:uncharacterized protein